MQIDEVRADKSGRELTKHGEQSFPVALYKNDMRRFLSRTVPWHWHNECEISVVTKGRMVLECGGSRFALNENEGYFVNRNLLHAVKSDGDTQCLFNSVLFDAFFISGSPYSIIHKKYVLPIIGRQDIPPLIFSKDGRAGTGLLDNIAEFESVWDGAAFMREIKLRGMLERIWEYIFKRSSEISPGTGYRYEPYIKTVLSYIHDNYSERLTLKSIAAAAGISVSTLNRCFRHGTGLSINEYISEYRVRMAAQKMSGENMTVTEACYACGFNEPSYFAKVFKNHTGMNPLEYKHAQAKLR